MPLGIKTGPTPGVTSLNQRNKDVEFICVENDSGEQSRAIMALLLYLHCPLALFQDKFQVLKIVEREENAGSCHFLLFPQNLMASYTGCENLILCGKGLKELEEEGILKTFAKRRKSPKIVMLLSFIQKFSLYKPMSKL